MSSGLKYLLKSFAAFILILVLIDFVAGGITQWVFYKQKTGKYARLIYSMDEADEDILILGSSHANRHYNPEIFEKVLNMTCYNAGVQGQGLVFIHILQNILLKRTTPKIIIINIDPNWLYFSQSSIDRLSEINPFYSKHPEEIKPFISIKNKYELLFLYSKLYMYNSTLAHIVKYTFSPQKDIKGYIPLKGEMKQIPQIDFEKNQLIKTDTFHVQIFKNLIDKTKKERIEVYAVISPSLLSSVSGLSLNSIIRILKEENIPILEHSNDTNFVGKPHLFYDASHLNNKGAAIFSEIIADEIINIRKLKN